MVNLYRWRNFTPADSVHIEAVLTAGVTALCYCSGGGYAVFSALRNREPKIGGGGER